MILLTYLFLYSVGARTMGIVLIEFVVNFYSLSGTTCTNSADAIDGVVSTTSGPIIDTSSDNNGINASIQYQ